MDTGEKFPLVKEGNKATHGIESLDTRLSKLEAECERSKLAQEAMRAEFQDYKEQLNVSLKEHLTHMMELQLRLTEAEDKLSSLQPEKQQPSESLARAQSSSGASLPLCASCGTPNLETQIAQTKGKPALLTLGTLPSTLSDDSVTQTMDGKNIPRIEEEPKACETTEDSAAVPVSSFVGWSCSSSKNSDKIERAACGAHKPGAEPSQAQHTSGTHVVRPQTGSWQCATCLLSNNCITIKCAACGTYKPVAELHQAQEIRVKSSVPFGAGTSLPGAEFLFGQKAQQTSGKPVFPFGSSTFSSGAEFLFGQKAEQTSGTHVVRPQTGSWQCATCLVTNNSDNIECAACGTYKPGAAPSQAQQTSGKPVFPFGSSTFSSGAGFLFGQKAEQTSGSHVVRPQTGSWDCDTCLVTNNSDNIECAACGTLKPGAAPSQAQQTSGTHVVRPQTGSWECATCLGTNSSDKIECAACGTLKPGAAPSQPQQTSGKPVFPFGSSTSSFGAGFLFGQKAEQTRGAHVVRPQTGSWQCATCLLSNNCITIKCAACGTYKPGVELHQAQKIRGKSSVPFATGTSSPGAAFSLTRERVSNGRRPEPEPVIGSPSVASLSFPSVPTFPLGTSRCKQTSAGTPTRSIDTRFKRVVRRSNKR